MTPLSPLLRLFRWDWLTPVAYAMACAALLFVLVCSSGCVTRVVVEPCQPVSPGRTLRLLPPDPKTPAGESGVRTYHDGCNTTTCYPSGMCHSTLLYCGPVVRLEPQEPKP